MSDWIFKFLGSIPSGKAAARVLGTILLVLSLWKPASKVFITVGFPDSYRLIFLTLLAFSASYLAVEFLGFCWLKIKSILDARTDRIKEQQVQEAFKDTIKKSLPNLSQQELSILRDLSDSAKRMDIRQEPVIWLMKSNWVSKIHNPSSSELILQLNPIVREIFTSFEDARHKEMVRHTISQLTEQQRQFLDLFWQETPVFGTALSKTMMPHDIYLSGDEMVRLHVLSKSKYNKSEQLIEQYSLNDFAQLMLENEVFGSPPIRHKIEVDLSYVKGSYASGAGAQGSLRRH